MVYWHRDLQYKLEFRIILQNRKTKGGEGMTNKIIFYKICEIDKKGKILFEFYNVSNLGNARVLKKQKIRHLTESNNLSGTVVILDNNNKIVN